MVGRSWDELLNDNGLGLTQCCPTCLPKTRAKRGRPLKGDMSEEPSSIAEQEGLDKLCWVVELEELNTLNPPKQAKENDAVEDKDVSLFHIDPVKLTLEDSQGDIMVDNGKIVIGEDEVNLECDSRNMQKVKPFEPVMNRYEAVNRRFTRSMANLSFPITIEQNKEPVLVEVCSDHEEESPLHEIPLNDYEHEQSSNHDNSPVSPKKILVDNSSSLGQPEHEVQCKPSLHDGHFLHEALEAVKQCIKLPLEPRINQLEGELKEVKEACNNLKAELHQ